MDRHGVTIAVGGRHSPFSRVSFPKLKLGRKCDVSIKGLCEGGIGIKKITLSLTFYKNFITCAKEINCFRIFSAC